jgi:ATP-dependent Clp protease adaptor protein ClpS
MNTVTKSKNKSKLKDLINKPYVLILENDDYNTFDWVIKCLIDVCNHEYDQAYQCALIVHYSGKCDVKYGDKKTISEMKEKLKIAGLSVTMDING